MIDELTEQHRIIVNIAAELRKRTTATELVDSDGLSRCRWRLHRALMGHLALEDEHVYRRLSEEARFDDLGALLAGKAETAALVDVYRAHFAYWTVDVVAADWRGYGTAVTELLGQLQARIRWEEIRLYPALRVAFAPPVTSAA